MSDPATTQTQTTTPTTAPTTTPLPTTTTWAGWAERPGLLATLVTVWSLLCHWYRFGVVNHGMQVPLMRLAAGEHAFDHDVFLQTLAHAYTTVFFTVVGHIARVVPLPALCFVLFVALRYATVRLSMRLGRVLFGNVWAGVTGAVIFSAQTLTFAEDMVSDVYLTHDTLAQLLGVAVLVLVVEQRFAAAFFVAGLIMPIQGLHATHLVPLLALALLGRVPLKNLVVAGSLACVGVLPVVAWMKHVGALGVTYPPDWVDFARAWFPTHYFPLHWTLFDWLHVVTPCLLAGPLWTIAAVDDRGLRRLFWLAVVVGLGLALVCEVWPNPFLIRLHPARASWVAWLAFVPVLGAATTTLWRRGDDVDRVTAIMLVFSATVSVFGRVPFLLVMTPMVWARARHRRGRATTSAAVAGVVLAVVVPVVVLVSKSLAIRAAPLWQAAVVFDGLVTLLAAVSVAVIAWRASSSTSEEPSVDDGGRRLWRAGVFNVAAMTTLHVLVFVLSSSRGAHHDWVDVQRWLKDHRPAGENVLVPLSRIGLRVHSNQTPALDFSDGLLSFHDPGYIPVLQEKLRAYGWKPGAVVHGFSFLENLDDVDRALSTDDLRRIADALHAPVAVREKAMPHLDLPVLYENKRFVVLDASSPSSSSTNTAAGGS